MKIYTKTGDEGSTSLWSGKRLKKNHPRLKAYGTVDELNSSLGIVLSHMPKPMNEHSEELLKTQKILFLLGSYLSCDDANLAKQLPKWSENWTKQLEDSIDKMQEKLPSLKNFILPMGHIASSQAHLSRCICRRAERNVLDIEEEILFLQESLRFLNRLSDYLFVLARKINAETGNKEELWTKESLED